MKQEKKRTTLYLVAEADTWITEQATRQGLSKNDIVQMLINNAMENERRNKPTGQSYFFVEKYDT